MKKRWGVVAGGVIIMALLGLWIELRQSPVCENCAAREMPFFQVFSAPTEDREARIKKFTSLARQNYPHFRVAISADEAKHEDVQHFIQQDPHRFVTLPDGYHSQELIYRWIHSVHSSDIIVLFPSEGMLELKALDQLQNFYSGSAAWVAFQGSVKKWAQDGVLTGYAHLFQKIKLQEFLDHGTFSENRSPENRLFELAGRHVRRLRGNFIDGKNYGYSWIAKSRKPYPRYRPGEEAPAPKTDLVIFSYDRPLQLYALLESTEKFIRHLEKITVVYRVSSSSYDQGYEIVKNRFPQMEFLKQGEHPESDFKPLVLKACFSSANPYIIFAVDDIVVTDTIDLQEGIGLMEKTGAHGVFYRLGRHIKFSYIQNRTLEVPPSIDLGHQAYAWQFSSGEGEWKFPNTVDMTLYRKSDIKELFTNLQYTHPTTLENKWDLKRKENGVGIYYDHAKILNIPMNIVNTSPYPHANSHTAAELLEKFLHGFKLDIKPLEGYRNVSAHIDLPVSFVPRDEIH